MGKSNHKLVQTGKKILIREIRMTKRKVKIKNKESIDLDKVATKSTIYAIIVTSFLYYFKIDFLTYSILFIMTGVAFYASGQLKQ